ncbi:hypothetical protein LZ198_36660 [Myxococcus sp. K15C18031901]|uniref:hypothetical protein n=1 Tax=Myxococcus dinghuensis TaxID=2906761 RepID=UPI0020A74EF2|nr:hypothetical protein [Myxococcus dinghuensis]MCP3104410.1 hypothetical protein [Myxococcus dinghuensis]
MRHLDDEALRALAHREPEAVTYFREHLATECEACECFLATHAGPDLLDGLTDQLLLGLAPPRPEPALDEVGFARIQKELRAHRPSARHWGFVAGVLAACLLAVVVVPRLRRPAPESDTDTTPAQGIKGVQGRIALELVAVVARGADGALRRLDPGSGVAPGDVLLLRYHATEAGTAQLLEQRGDEAPFLLGQFPLEAGTHDLRGPQGLAGVSLEDEAGPVTLWLVAAPGGMDPSLDQVRAALAHPDEPGGSSPLAISRFDVRVRSGENPP